MRKRFSGRVAEMVGGGRARLDCYDTKGMAGSGFGVGAQYRQFALLWVRKKIGGGGGGGEGVGTDGSQFLQAWVWLLQGGGTYPRWRICDYSLLTTLVRRMIFATLRMIPIPYKSLIFYLNMACTSLDEYGDMLPIGSPVSPVFHLTALFLFRAT
jgi:hypothetical protein